MREFSTPLTFVSRHFELQQFILNLMACSYRRHGQDKTVLSRPRRRWEQVIKQNLRCADDWPIYFPKLVYWVQSTFRTNWEKFAIFVRPIPKPRPLSNNHIATTTAASLRSLSTVVAAAALSSFAIANGGPQVAVYRQLTPSPGWGPRGQGPAKIVRAPAKITGLFMFLKNRKRPVCSMEAGADCGSSRPTLIAVVTRLTA